MVILKYKGHELEILPDRGAIISYWKYKGEDVLYEDPYLQINRIIRGGMPVLFPICGEMENNYVSFNEKQYRINRHGFARDCQWELIKCEDDCIYLQLQSNPQTLVYYPYLFKVEIEYRVNAEGLTVKCQVWNFNSEEMPYQIGFHPYFLVENKIASCPIYDWQEEVNNYILDKQSIKVVQKSFNTQVKIEECFDRFVIWSIPESPFICVEPWLGGVNSLNDIHRHQIKAFQSKIHQFSIKVFH